jgi:TrmH family RNA methyltransferase
MTRPILITSKSNQHLRGVRRLARTRSRERFLVEGHRALRCALEARSRVLEVYSCPELFLGERDTDLVGRAARCGALVHELSREAFLSVSGQVRADGVLAVVARPPTTMRDVGPFVVVAEGIERPGNLGAIVRTAVAAGADTLVVCDGRTDAFHPEVVRGAVGTIFNIRIAVATSADASERLRGHRVLVATPEAALPFWAADYAGPAAVVVGSERHGVSDTWRAVAAETVAIPMAPAADSLNVSVAAGIVLMEAARQRAASGASSTRTRALSPAASASRRYRAFPR